MHKLKKAQSTCPVVNHAQDLHQLVIGVQLMFLARENKSLLFWLSVLVKIDCSELAFPRDGKSHCPFVPGQRNFLVPVSLCPGTRAGANVPGQTPLSRDVPGQNHLPKKAKKQEKVVVKQEKDVPKQEKEVPKQENEVPKQERTF